MRLSRLENNSGVSRTTNTLDQFFSSTSSSKKPKLDVDDTEFDETEITESEDNSLQVNN